MKEKIIKAFVDEKSDKIKLFWSIGSDFNPKALWLSITHIFIPISLIFYGLIIIALKFESKPAPYSVLDFIFDNLIIIKSSGTYIVLWITYFLLASLICLSSFKKAKPELEKFKAEVQSSYLKKISNSFTSIETTIFVALKISEELHKYAITKIPSDLGLRGDLDFIVGKYYNRLVDKPIFSTYGSRLITNSFFVDLKNETDIIKRLDLNSWYNEKSAKKDGIYDNLFKIKDILYKKAVFGDYEKGAIVFSKIAEVFISADNKEKDNFRISLEELSVLIGEYEKSREPTRGLPLLILNAIKWVVNRRFVFLNLILALIIAIGLFHILPLYIFKFLRTRFQNPPTEDVIRNITFGVVTIYVMLPKKIRRD